MQVSIQSEIRGAEAVARQERRAQYERDFDAAVAAVPSPDVDMATDPVEPSYDEMYDYSVFQADQ
jgi:hypothetical protein